MKIKIEATVEAYYDTKTNEIFCLVPCAKDNIDGNKIIWVETRGKMRK